MSKTIEERLLEEHHKAFPYPRELADVVLEATYELEARQKNYDELVGKLWCLRDHLKNHTYSFAVQALEERLPPRPPTYVEVPWHEAIEMLRDGRAFGAETADRESIHWSHGRLVRDDGEMYYVWEDSIDTWCVELAQ